MPDLDDERPDAADATMLAALGHALGSDPVPAGLTERAIELLAMADADVALVRLLEEADNGLVGAGSRGDGGTAAPVVYTSPDGSVTIEVELDERGLHGLVLGADASTVRLVTAAGATDDAPVEALGRFRFDDATRGPARLHVTSTVGTFSTEWFVV